MGTPRLSRLAQPALRQPTILRWATDIAGQHGKTVRLSDAGRRAEVLQRLVGGRQPLAELLAGQMLPILRGFLSSTGNTKDRYPDGEGVVLHAAGTNDAGWEGYLTFEGDTNLRRPSRRERADRRHRHPHHRPDPDPRHHRRLRHLRPCQLVSLDTAGHTNTCPRCTATNSLTQPRWRHPAKGPQWFFDLHPVARDLLGSNGEVPLQLAHHLRALARSYTDASEFELCEAGRPKAELDLPAHADKQVIVGEAKSSNTLGSSPAKEVKEKILLADLLHADQLLFATTQPQ
ncbi:hypothetical protein [Paractinoplanes hotanensis]|uniref:Uncharacterized protein n=1 Tax=Paractinoplanes hotanensis TaxID=2906497 RepID=A0ABT0Y8W5_9ACTN|nr:hypothetical protein [Actinoplanes hotanensis]MCM4082275.1 hypothetical protein [Actinoplanes hotanensis]